MAYIVMAYIAVAYIIMAYIVMAYIVAAYIVMAATIGTRGPNTRTCLIDVCIVTCTDMCTDIYGEMSLDGVWTKHARTYGMGYTRRRAYSTYP